MLKHPTEKPDRFTARRFAAWWVFACLLWMSAAAPFAHTCTANATDNGRASISNGMACASCDWLTLERSTSVDVPAESPIPQLVSTAFVPCFDSACVQPVGILSTRGPPA